MSNKVYSIVNSFLNLFGEHNLDVAVAEELQVEDPENAEEILKQNEQTNRIDD